MHPTKVFPDRRNNWKTNEWMADPQKNFSTRHDVPTGVQRVRFIEIPNKAEKIWAETNTRPQLGNTFHYPSTYMRTPGSCLLWVHFLHKIRI